MKTAFQCSSASRKFLNRGSTRWDKRCAMRFSALQRAENSSIVDSIPSSIPTPSGFSALQRAENSSIAGSSCCRSRYEKFQCSSASRKFLNRSLRGSDDNDVGFSALQRAENSSIYSFPLPSKRLELFQCSSASRKFLNTEAVGASE